MLFLFALRGSSPCSRTLWLGHLDNPGRQHLHPSSTSLTDLKPCHEHRLIGSRTPKNIFLASRQDTDVVDGRSSDVVALAPKLHVFSKLCKPFIKCGTIKKLRSHHNTKCAVEITGTAEPAAMQYVRHLHLRLPACELSQVDVSNGRGTCLRYICRIVKSLQQRVEPAIFVSQAPLTKTIATSSIPIIPGLLQKLLAPLPVAFPTDDV